MAYVFAEGGYGVPATVIHPDSSHPDTVTIPDAELLLNGKFHRAGADLHLSGWDGQHVVIPGYFASEHPAALVGPNGGRLSAHDVALLAAHLSSSLKPTTTAARCWSDGPDQPRPSAQASRSPSPRRPTLP
jgi:hypothetical protein